MSKRAYGSITYFTPGDRPHEVRWRCGGNREELSCWKDEGIAHTATGRVTDLWARPGVAMFLHVLVADIDGVAHYTVSPLQDDFTAAMSPFALTQGTASGLRCFERAQGYWLVTFVRDGRVFWGEIDWIDAAGQIRELTSVTDLQRALGIVGVG